MATVRPPRPAFRTHPEIAALLKDPKLSEADRKAVLAADASDKVSRAHPHPGFHHTRGSFVDSVFAQLIKAGLPRIDGQSTDVWFLRTLREYDAIRDRDKQPSTIS